MTSVERVVEYTELESEAPWETQKRPPPSWPSRGLVTFDQVSFSYSTDGPLVLQDMKAMFRPKEKVCFLSSRSSLFGLMLSDVASCSACARLGLWVEPVPGKAPWSQLCSAWLNLRERSTSTEF